MQSQWEDNMKSWHMVLGAKLYIDCNGSQEYGMAGFLYMIEGDSDPEFDLFPTADRFEQD